MGSGEKTNKDVPLVYERRERGFDRGDGGWVIENMEDSGRRREEERI